MKTAGTERHREGATEEQTTGGQNERVGDMEAGSERDRKRGRPSSSFRLEGKGVGERRIDGGREGGIGSVRRGWERGG